MERYTLDVTTKTLTVTEKFNKKLQDPTSDEFALYTKLMETIPGLTVANRTHKSATSYTTKSGEKFNCNQFKNLTYDRMEKFIAALPKNEGYLREYLFVKNYASAIQHNGYTLVRKWFVAQFPEFRKNPLFYLYNTPELVSGFAFLEEETAAPAQMAA